MSGYLIHYVNESNYLAHHGILGQHWGVKHGPPYPLGSGASTGSRLKEGAKKVGASIQKSAKKTGKAIKKNAAESKKIREFNSYVKKRQQRDEIEQRRRTHYAGYMAGKAAGAALAGSVGMGALGVGRMGGAAGGINALARAGGINAQNVAIVAGSAALAGTARAVIKTNRQKKIDDIKYKKLTKQLNKYEIKNNLPVSSIPIDYNPLQKKSKGTIQNANGYSQDYLSSIRDPKLMSDRELGQAIYRKEQEAKYKEATKSDSQKFAEALAKDSAYQMSTSAAKSFGKAAGAYAFNGSGGHYKKDKDDKNTARTYDDSYKKEYHTNYGNDNRSNNRQNKQKSNNDRPRTQQYHQDKDIYKPKDTHMDKKQTRTQYHAYAQKDGRLYKVHKDQPNPRPKNRQEYEELYKYREKKKKNNK